jgi:hypothetical protein
MCDMSEHKHDFQPDKLPTGSIHITCKCDLDILVFPERITAWHFGQEIEHLGDIDLTVKVEKVASCYTPDSCTDPRD